MTYQSINLDKNIKVSKRTRNINFIKAHEEIQKSTLAIDWDKIELCANEYKREIHDKEIILIREEDQKLLKIPYITRFSNQYKEKQLKKIREFTNSLKKTGESAMFLTLTIDPKLFTSINEMHQAIKKEFHKLYHAIKRNKTFVIGKITGYIVVEELQKNLNPHLHVVLRGAEFINADYIRSLWHIGTFVFVERIYRIGGIVSYLGKYISKNIKSENWGNIILWALNARIISNSLSLITDKTKCAANVIKKGFVYIGVAPINAIVSYYDVLTFFGT
ncbi:MAG: hypothetical protein QXV17_10755 [Candidatus Micrarchaeaceae archaeon]